MGVGREIVRAHDEKMWKDEKTQEKKKGTQLIFIGILILVIIEDVKG